MYYIGFLKKDARHAMVFRSIKTPKKDDLTYFLHVMGPYGTERMARSRVNLMKRYGYRENPIKEKMQKVVMGADKAISITKKLIRAYETLRHQNPGKSYHDKKFLLYIGELEKYKVGSPPYIATLAKAYEHLESAKESVKEGVR
jgi:hypothetical protein